MVETLEQALSPEMPIAGKQRKRWSMEDIANADVAHYNRVARADQIMDKTASNLGVFDRVVEGTATGIADMINKTPDHIKIFYGQTQMDIGLKTGDVEKISVGKALIQTATRNLDMINEEMEKRTVATDADKESFAYGTGNALASYGSMWFTAGVLGRAARVMGVSSKAVQAVGAAGGIANMTVQEMGGEVEEGIQVYREKNPEDQNLENITPEWASKEVMTTIAYGTVSGIIEKKMGFGLQRKMFLKPMDIVKRGIVGGASEYTTENLQSLANMGIDLADSSMDWSKLPQRLKDEFVGNLPALLIGAGGGVSMGVDQRAQTKNAIREMVKNSVPSADLETVVNTVYNSAVENLSGIVAKELEISSELQAKHGAIYDSMIKAVAQTIDASGSQNFGDEAEKARYINDVSKRFADEVLAEANMRGAPIDEVLDATDIVFEDGGIKFKHNVNILDYVTGARSIPKEFRLPRTDLLAFLKAQGGIRDVGGDIRSMGAIKQYPGLVNNAKGKSLDDLTLSAWQSGYFPDQMERPDLDYMREKIDRALRGEKIYNREQESTVKEEIDNVLEQLDRMGIDYRNKTTAQLEEEIAGIDELKSLQREYEFYLENELIQEMEQLERPEGYEPEFDDVYNQGAKGSYNPNERLIKLFSGADYSTLSHELSHYWLDSMWTYVRSGQASPAYLERWGTIANYLNIRPEQTRLTKNQQEKFAGSYEKYLTKGDLPVPMLKGAFDEYDNWLKKVYNDANNVRYQKGKKQKPVQLTDDAIRFFDSMTTGALPPPAVKPVTIADLKKKAGSKQKTPVQDLNARLKAMKQGKPVPTVTEEIAARSPETTVGNQVQAEALNDIDNPVVREGLAPVPNVVPTTQISNITEGEKGESGVYSREVDKNRQQLGDELADSVEYSKINLEEQSVKALKFVRENLEAAKKVVDGGKAPDGLLDTAIRIAYESEMLRTGNNAEYARALKLHSAIQTARGQEIAAERLATNDMLQPKYWLSKLLASREAKVVSDLFKGNVSEYQKAIKQETKDAVKDLLGLDLEAQMDYLSGLADNIREKYNIDDVLYQTPLEEPLNEETAPLFVRNFLEETFGASVSEAEATTIINKADQLARSFENSLDANGNPSVESFKILSEMNKTIESFAPSAIVTVVSSILGRSNMLASIKSPTLNIISNIENFATEAVARRLSGGNYEMSVDKEAIKAYREWTWNVYKASGFIPSQMLNIADEITTLGETRPTSQGKGRIRQVSQTMENIVFKYLMGAPDAVAKDYTFVDSADLQATAIAKSEGLSGEAMAKRATEIFNDAILIQPQTEAGMAVREKAVEEAHISTYTNNSLISDWALKGRDWLNGLGTGKLRAGDLLMPFVKTPANVAMLGLEYGLGGLYTAYNIPQILKNPKSPQAQRAIKAGYRNGLGVILSLLLASLMDPEDYIPEFDNATQKDRDLARAKNAPFNSIKIGNKYVSLDYFGPLAVPLVGILNARRSSGLKDTITNYIKGTVTQAGKIPGVKEVMAINDSIQRIAASSTTPEKMIEQVTNDVIDQIRARTVPAIVNDIAKIIDPHERDTSEGIISKVQASIPGLRNMLPERYNIEGSPQESENPLNVLFFGSRVKTATEGSVINEIERLSSKKEQPSISDVTRYGDLRHLSPSEKVSVRQQYSKEFAKAVRAEMSSRTYKGKDDEDKKKAINKIRSNIVKDIKAKYAKNIDRSKKESR